MCQAGGMRRRAHHGQRLGRRGLLRKLAQPLLGLRLALAPAKQQPPCRGAACAMMAGHVPITAMGARRWYHGNSPTLRSTDTPMRRPTMATAALHEASSTRRCLLFATAKVCAPAGGLDDDGEVAAACSGSREPIPVASRQTRPLCSLALPPQLRSCVGFAPHSSEQAESESTTWPRSHASLSLSSGPGLSPEHDGRSQAIQLGSSRRSCSGRHGVHLEDELGAGGVV